VRVLGPGDVIKVPERRPEPSGAVYRSERAGRGPVRIAVLRANAVGDFIFALPALDSLRAAYPDAEIVLLGAPWHARFLAARPGPVDRVMVVPPLAGVREAEPGEPDQPRDEFVEKARLEQFDIALQLHGGGRNTNPLVAALGAGMTAGLRADDAPPLDRWIRYVYYQPEVFRYLEVVGLVGALPVSYRPALAVTDADRRQLRAVLPPPSRPRVALHPGSSDPRRRWPAERFAELGDALSDVGAEVVVTGTGAESSVVRAVLTEMRAPATPVVDTLQLGGLAALYAECDVLVSNDTGPVHLAEAVGAATVGIYWAGNFINGAPTDRTRHRPMISWTLHCPVCGLDCTRDIYPARGGGHGCTHKASFVADVPAVEVRDATLELLAGRRS
jgi:ADP-heptose:LPS heptosyltransferase